MHLTQIVPNEDNLLAEITRRASIHCIVKELEELFRQPERLVDYNSLPYTEWTSPLWSVDGNEPIWRVTGKHILRADAWHHHLGLIREGRWANLTRALRLLKFNGSSLVKPAGKLSPSGLVATLLCLYPIQAARIEVSENEVVVHDPGTKSLTKPAFTVRFADGVLTDEVGNDHHIGGPIDWGVLSRTIQPIRMPHIVVCLRQLLGIDDPYLEFLLTWFCAIKTNSLGGTCKQFKGDVKFGIKRMTASDLAFVDVGPQPIGVSGVWDTTSLGKSRSIRDLKESVEMLGGRETIPVNLLELFNHHVVEGKMTPEAFQLMVGPYRKVVKGGKAGIWPVSAFTIRRWFSMIYDI